MTAKRKANLPTVLMALSLLLLAVFEIFWLRSEYEDQKEWLRIEQSHFFYSAIRSLEDSLFNEMVLQPLQIRTDSFEFSDPQGRKLLFQRDQDTADYLTVVRSIDLRERRRNYRSALNKGPRPHRSILLGALSMHINNSKDSVVVAEGLERLIAVALADEHEQAPADLPREYELLHWHKGDSIQTMGLMSAPYMDYWSQQNFAIAYPDYKGFLLSRIWRQIVFAMILFACIAGAFALIYKTLMRQRRLSELRTDFINNITHELKTPISTVRVALEAITNFNVNKDPEKEKEYFGIAQSELNRLTLLVDRVLQMSQMNDGETEMQFEQFDLKDLTSQIMSTMKVQFDRKQADVNLNASGESFSIEGDRMHLTGVVYNLLDNAIKYGNGNPKIDVNIIQDNGTIEIDVADNGKGIAPEYVDKVFDKFFRVPTGDRHNIKGHGLGLSYVAEVVEKHHGTIRVDSKPGAGSTFKITLPRRHVN